MRESLSCRAASGFFGISESYGMRSALKSRLLSRQSRLCAEIQIFCEIGQNSGSKQICYEAINAGMTNVRLLFVFILHSRLW